MKKYYFTDEQLEEIRKAYSTLPTDGNGEVQDVIYSSEHVRNDVLKLIADLKKAKKMNKYKLFKVNEEYPEYIVAQTEEEALNDHNERGGKEGAVVTIDEVEEISLDTVGDFEQEDGSKLMSFRDFLGQDFVYEEPTLICWTD
ncbi:hypothetical protein [Brevibacillus laterosporus]|uniref:hypothetical protein n=1 Tax=Brevibacillus laterosporus TaxID=1465 RepID=UPI002E1E838A|nr:hypothetical protein [Brevibacillus laterosporus]MED1667249.1 hypothetical protein [Brevibacillus laterosporus]MED1719683.1 hypothetical protein [Brevibacillus laterosporus]